MQLEEIYSGLMEGTLIPRYHSGVGMLQMYLTPTVRLHLWHPELPRSIEAFGNRHSHRFDLTSYILLGSIVDMTLQLEPKHFTGEFLLYKVMPAHFGETPIPKQDDSTHDLIVKRIRQYKQGDSYTVPLGAYHETRADDLTMTLMVKSNQVDDWAHIIGHKSQEPVHAMEVQPPLHVMKQLMFMALRRLPQESKDLIEKISGENHA